MIQSFGDKATEHIWNGIRSKDLPNEIQELARRKLRMLNNSMNIKDLMIPPSNKLEKLKGNLKDYSNPSWHAKKCSTLLRKRRRKKGGGVCSWNFLRAFQFVGEFEKGQ